MSITLQREAPTAPPAGPPTRRSGAGEVLIRMALPLSVAAVCLAVWHFGIAWTRAWDPSTTPPTAATSSTIEVTSNASRWSVRNNRPIDAGEPNERSMCASCESVPPERLSIRARMIARAYISPATTARCSR